MLPLRECSAMTSDGTLETWPERELGGVEIVPRGEDRPHGGHMFVSGGARGAPRSLLRQRGDQALVD